jgi:hypothetical protein
VSGCSSMKLSTDIGEHFNRLVSRLHRAIRLAPSEVQSYPATAVAVERDRSRRRRVERIRQRRRVPGASVWRLEEDLADEPAHARRNFRPRASRCAWPEP